MEAISGLHKVNAFSLGKVLGAVTAFRATALTNFPWFRLQGHILIELIYGDFKSYVLYLKGMLQIGNSVTDRMILVITFPMVKDVNIKA